jgi:WD40 repeat protein
MLAVGSHDNYIDIYTTSLTHPTLQDPPSCTLQQVRRMKGHTSYLTHLDWSLDNTLIRSTCGAYELLYWTLPAGKMCTSSFDTIEADTVWHTSSCVLGFNVMGIWAPGSDGTDVNCVDTSEAMELVATGLPTPPPASSLS